MGGGSSDQLRMLEQVSGDVNKEGRDEVVGVQATHYHGSAGWSGSSPSVRAAPGQARTW